MDVQGLKATASTEVHKVPPSIQNTEGDPRALVPFFPALYAHPRPPSGTSNSLAVLPSKATPSTHMPDPSPFHLKDITPANNLSLSSIFNFPY